MKKILTIATCLLCLFSCKNNEEKGRFTVTGEIKNVSDQKIYIEQLYFSQQPPEVLDTAEIKGGKFTISTLGQEEGLYRLRLENGKNGFIFINDSNNIQFSADLNNPTFQNTSFNTYANSLLKNFVIHIDSLRNAMEEADAKLQEVKEQKASDSIIKVTSKDLDDKNGRYKKYVVGFIDSVSDPVMAVFAIGYTNRFDPNELVKVIAGLGKRFPKNATIQATVAQYGQLISQFNATPHIGGMAPDISLPDTSGKPFALSNLRGKYVLVDFWASWCAPCRAENPNVVNAYNTYKDKNFTVLGVSLDQNKQSWISAINADKLTWTHISDLKSWDSKAVSLYGFDGIPYNVLVDPLGKIIAVGLRGKELELKLAEVLR